MAHPRRLADKLPWSDARGRALADLSVAARALADLVQLGWRFAARGVGGALRHASDRIEGEGSTRHTALRDVLTGLPNRMLLMDRMEQAFRSVGDAEDSVVLLVLDLDRFKLFNDALGRGQGDQLIRQLAHRLDASLSETDTLARLGGDSFAVLTLAGGGGWGPAAELAERLLSAAAEPLEIDATNHYLSASVGVAVREDGQTAMELLRNADSAMHLAKEQGGGRFQLFDEALFHRAVERLRIANDLREAVPGAQLVLHYQPQIDLRTGVVIDLEALVRWEHPSMGRLMPDDFLGVAEAVGQMDSIGRWVVRSGLDDFCRWSGDEALDGMGIAINLSVSELLSGDLNAEVAAMLEEPGIDARRVTFEITESAAMGDPEAAIGALSCLRDAGARIAVDDFGTGYSSMVYLRRLPVDILKIDRQFTDGVAAEGSEDSAIVEATLGLGRALRLECVAEGVETADQEAALRRLGCERAQGWRYAKALPLDQALTHARRSRQATTHPER